MSMKILITGGAGFIGQSLARHLLTLGHEISLLDNFLPQVHAGKTTLPPDLANDVRLVSGDVADPRVLQSGLAGQQGVVHFAAETGTGQSMYEVVRYERNGSDNAESKVYLSKKLLPEMISRHRSKKAVVQSSV